MIVNVKVVGVVYVFGWFEFKVDNNIFYLDRIVVGIFYFFLNSICWFFVLFLYILFVNFFELGMYYDFL